MSKYFGTDIVCLDKRPSANLFRWYKETRRLYFHRKYFKKQFDGKNMIVVNQDIKHDYKKYLNYANIHHLPNGVDQRHLLAHIDSPSPTNKKWDCIFVGRLSAEKQPEHAITAFAKSGATGRMAIVGDGALYDELKTLCQKLNIADRVDFLGWQKNPYPYIAQAKVLVLSSLSEGFGLVISEALVLGTPVIAYDVGDGVRYQLAGERLSQGLVENQNLEKLSQKLGEIIKNPYPIYQTDIEKLSLKNMVANFIHIINENPPS